MIMINGSSIIIIIITIQIITGVILSHGTPIFYYFWQIGQF